MTGELVCAWPQHQTEFATPNTSIDACANTLVWCSCSHYYNQTSTQSDCVRNKRPNGSIEFRDKLCCLTFGWWKEAISAFCSFLCKVVLKTLFIQAEYWNIFRKKKDSDRRGQHLNNWYKNNFEIGIRSVLSFCSRRNDSASKCVWQFPNINWWMTN